MTAQISLTKPSPARLTVEDFMVLEQAGAFADYAKTELIDGVIYVVNAQFSEHMMTKVRLLRRLADACDALGAGLEAWSEGAVALGPRNLPEPDIFVTSRTPTTGPVPGQTIMLVVEVSDTTRTFDLGKKARLYAGGGVPEYWVVDLAGGKLHQMWSPGTKGYVEKREVALGERIEAVTIAGLGAETAGLN